jgi:hypothetical protein
MGTQPGGPLPIGELTSEIARANCPAVFQSFPLRILNAGGLIRRQLFSQ